MRTLCIGHIVYDIILPVGEKIETNKKYYIKNTYEKITNPIINASILLSNWDLDVNICGVCGKDYYGDKLMEILRQNEVNTDYLQQQNGIKTDINYTILNNNKETTTIISENPKIHDLIDIPVKSSVILMDGEELLTSIKTIENNPLSLTILNADNTKEDTLTLAKKVNYLICTINFIEEYTKIKIDINNIDTIICAYQELELSFKNNIILNLGKNGSFTKIKDEYCLVPTIKTDEQEIGNIENYYCGAFTYFLEKNYPLLKAMYLANITSTLMNLNNKENSIPSLEEVLERGNVNDII